MTGAENPHAVTGLVVRVGGARWFVEVHKVIEVLRAPPVARVPSADPAVVGLVNHRGRVLTVADPVRALDLTDGAVAGWEVVVVEAAGHRFAVAIDAVIELVSEPRTGLATLDLDAIASAIFA
jgi:purine-binding chemotaxis protein CheW